MAVTSRIPARPEQREGAASGSAISVESSVPVFEDFAELDVELRSLGEQLQLRGGTEPDASTLRAARHRLQRLLEKLRSGIDRARGSDTAARRGVGARSAAETTPGGLADSNRQAEARSRLGELHMQLIADNATDFAISTLDLDGRVTHWSKGAERLFGWTEAEMLGQPADCIFVPEDVAAGAPAAEIRAARETGRAVDERWHQRKDGSRVYCSGVMSPLHQVDLQGYAKIARDLTDARRSQEQRDALLASETRLRARLQEASTAKDEFLGVMSHELKHPLNLIGLHAELLLRLPGMRQHPEVGKAADVIRQTVARQARIVDNLLDLSRLGTGKLSLDLTATDWAGIVERVVAGLQAQAAAKPVSIRVDLDAGATLVLADRVRLEQVVSNLLGNALKFTRPGGKVAIRLWSDGGMSRLDVVDDGRGIDPALLAVISERLDPAVAAPTRSTGRMGVGLELVHHLVDAHGGRMEVASDGLGRGTRVSVWLRTTAPDSEAAVAGTPAALTSMRILLIDDSEETLDAFAGLLRSEGAEVTSAVGGNAALDTAVQAEAPFDLVLSDIGMPDMDGYQLVGRLREQPQLQSVPIIALTGFGTPNDRTRALEAGFDAHLPKPIRIERLLQTIQRLRLRPAPRG